MKLITPSQEMISMSSPTSQPNTDRRFADNGRKPRTDAQIQEFIAEEIARFKSSCQSQKKPTVPLHQAVSDIPPSRKNELPATATVHCQQSSSSINAGPQLEKETLRIIASKSELIQKSKEREYLEIPSEVGATCTENKEDNSVVLTIISSMTCREVTENGSLLEEEHKSQFCGNRDVVPDVSHALEHILQKRENDPYFENIHDHVTVTASSNTIQVETTADPQNDHHVWKEEHIHFMPKPSTDKTSFVSTVPNEIKNTCLPGSMAGETLLVPALKDPQYEDISEDEDKPTLGTESYEDLSENRIPCTQNAVEEMPSLQPGTCDTAQFDESEQSCLECVGEADLELQINYRLSSFSVLKDDNDDYEDDDDDDDDDWAVLPLQILDLKFEQAEKQLDQTEILPQDDGDQASWDGKGPRHSEPALKPVPASAFQQMEVFDSQAEQEQAFRSGHVSYVIVPSCSSLKQKSHESTNDSHSEPEDSYETDDSSDYSCTSERNYLTASRQLVQNFSVPETTHFQKAQALGGENCSTDITITIDSDTESENDCMEIRVENPPPLTKNSGTDFGIEQRGLSPNILEVRNKIQITSPPSVDTPAPEHDVSLNLSRDTETLNQVQNKVARQTCSNDENVIVITSDSDDEIYNEAKSPSTWQPVDNGNNFSLNQKDNTTTAKRRPQDPKGSSGDSSKLRSISMRPGKIPDLKTNLTASEDSQDPLTNPGNVCVKRRKVQKTPSGPRSSQGRDLLSELDSSLGDDPVIARMLVQSSPLTKHVKISCAPRVQRQDQDKSMFTSNSLTGMNKGDSLIQKLRHSLRGESGRFAPKPKPKHRVVKTTLGTSNQNSLAHDRHVSSAKRQRSHSRISTSVSPLTPKTDPTSSSVKRSAQKPSHARTKIFSDWQKNHVPIRRERKALRRTNDLRHNL